MRPAANSFIFAQKDCFRSYATGRRAGKSRGLAMPLIAQVGYTVHVAFDEVQEAGGQIMLDAGIAF